METGVRVGQEGRRTYAEVKTRSELLGFTRRLGQRVTHQLPYEPRRGIAFLKEYTSITANFLTPSTVAV